MIISSNQQIYFLKKNYYLYLIFVSLFTLSIKWVLPILEGEINLNSLVLFNLEDTQYFPIIYSLSEFNFAPTYIDIIDSKKIIGFPLLGALTHSVFFKFIGIYAFIFLEIRLPTIGSSDGCQLEQALGMKRTGAIKAGGNTHVDPSDS